MAKQRRVDFEKLRTQVVRRRRLLEMPGDIVIALSYSRCRCFGHPKDRPHFADKSASNSLKRAQLLQREPRGKSLLFITLIHFDGPVGRPVQKITGMAGSSKTTMVLED